jgi:hypothetical protein
MYMEISGKLSLSKDLARLCPSCSEVILIQIFYRAIQRDPEIYPEPESFRPDRWLEPSFPTFREPLTKYPSIQNFSVFGFGRRVCPGMHIAERSLFIQVATIAWACTMSPKMDESGKPIAIPWFDFTEGINIQPKTFPFDLKPRSGAKSKFVTESWIEARDGNKRETEIISRPL